MRCWLTPSVQSARSGSCVNRKVFLSGDSRPWTGSFENPAFTSYSRALEKMNTLKAATAQARSVVGIVAAAEDATGHVASPDLPQGLEGDVLVKRAMAALDVVRQMALDELVSGKEKLVTAVEDVAAEEEKYAPTLTAEKAKYEAMVAKAGGDPRALTAQRDALATRLDSLRGRPA